MKLLSGNFQEVAMSFITASKTLHVHLCFEVGNYLWRRPFKTELISQIGLLSASPLLHDPLPGLGRNDYAILPWDIVFLFLPECHHQRYLDPRRYRLVVDKFFAECFLYNYVALLL